MSTKSVASEILEKQDRDGSLRRACERIIRLYTDSVHFIYELLQNAEDAGATKIRFDQYEDRLEVLHDGRPFSIENLQGLCDIGLSDKTKNLNQIGEFGVGFKSVYSICERVLLYSHPSREDIGKGYIQFAVEIHDFMYPEDIEDQEIDPGYTTKFVFPYYVKGNFSGYTTFEQLNEKLAERLQNLGTTTLLFMKNLQIIEYRIFLNNIKKQGCYQLEKDYVNDHCVLVSAVEQTEKKKNGDEIFYLMYSRPVKGIQTGRTIDIAFAIAIQENGIDSFVPVESPYVSVYFPTETESKLNFIVQGPYRTTPNRGNIPSDDPENQELARQTALLLRDSVLELRDSGKLTYSLLNILPMDDKVFRSAPLFKSSYDATKDMMANEAIYRCNDGSYASKESVKIARNAELTEVFNDELLTELYNDGTNYHWLPVYLTETSTEYRPLYNFLTTRINVNIIRPEHLRDAFNSNPAFLSRQDDKWLEKFYKLYSSVPAAFSREKGGAMISAKIIKTTKNTFVAPYRKSGGEDQTSSGNRRNVRSAYLPNVFLPVKDMKDMEDVNFVNEKVLKNSRAFFTETLHLEKPDRYEFFIQGFKNRSQNGTISDYTQHIKDLKELLRYLGDVDRCDEVKEIIKDNLILRCFKDGEIKYANPCKEKVLFSVTSDGMSIEQYYRNIEDFPYIDIDFYVNNGITRKDLEFLGVSENIEVGTSSYKWDYKRANPGWTPLWENESDFLWNISLDKLDEVLLYISTHSKAADSMSKSAFIFRFLQNNEAVLSGKVYEKSDKTNIQTDFANIIKVLTLDKGEYFYSINQWDGKWLYTESGELVAAWEISKRDLNPMLYGKVKQDSKLYDMLGFRKNDYDLMEEAEESYDKLEENQQERLLDVALHRRFGLSIEDIENNFGEFARKNSSQNIYGNSQPMTFPSARVKHWDSLRKHVAEELVYANPVDYEYKVRRIRVSRPDREIDSYLRGMYKLEDSHKFVCQMCHKEITEFEKCQLSLNMDKELEPFYLCLCPNCAAKYKGMRHDKSKTEKFLNNIKELTEARIDDQDPVKVDFNGESIWFTQTHIAEIRELMILKEAVEDYVPDDKEEPKINSDNQKSLEQSEESEGKKTVNTKAKPLDKQRLSQSERPPVDKQVNSRPKPTNDKKSDQHQSKDEDIILPGTSVYKNYIGKNVHHQTCGDGIVKSCDGVSMTIEFNKGKYAGETKKFMLEFVLKPGVLEIIE